MNNFRISLKAVGSAIIIFLLITCTNFAQSKPWMNKNLSPHKRAELLVKQMTLNEKILEIHMMDTHEHPREVSGIERLGIPPFKITNGPCGAGPGDKNPTQPATALPSGLALAASWDTSLAGKFGRIAGQEVADRGEDLIEGPGLNIARIPQNGRNFEYFGEDPYLSGRMAVSEVFGIQSQDVIAEIKHFAANNQEDDRKTINEIIDERTLREIYLPAFKAAVEEAHPGAVMAAYPSVNGQFGCENVHLLKDILRGDWGFKGFVQSDYTATKSAVRSSRAGLDLSMKHDHYGDEMKQAVLKGQVPELAVDSMVVRRFTQIFQFGLLDNPKTPKPIPEKKDGAVSRSIAEQSAVLLKNSDGLLPLNSASINSIALIGPYAGEALTGGSGSSHVKPLYTVSPVEGIQNIVGSNVKVTYNDGGNVSTAAKIAASSDVVLLMLGNKDSEGHDRPNLSLPGNQDSLVYAVAAANHHTIVVLKTGGPVLMPWLSQVNALLEVWYPGEEDGSVVANLVFGKVNPSGKLPMTFPKSENDVPAHTPQQYPGVNGTAVYSEGLDVGYRWYDAKSIEPLFPFGFGLSYTTFTFKNISINKIRNTNGSVQVSLEVTNTGSRDGADVVQVYVADPANVGEPPKQLKGFDKVTLRPGQTKQVTITLGNHAFSIWNTKLNKWTKINGEYTILAGDSSTNLPLKEDIEITEGQNY
jgi:beta-glucosidase